MKNDLIKLCVDSHKGIITNFSKGETSEAIRKAFVGLMGTDKPDHRQFRKHQADIFEILEVVLDDIIDESWDKNVFFNQFVEYRDLNLGDTNEFYVEDKSMLRVSRIADGHWDLRAQKLNIGDSFTINTQTYGSKVYSDFRLFLAGRIDFASLINKIQEAFKLQMAQEIYTSFASTSNFLPSQFTHTGSFSEDKMDDIIAHVKASSNFADLVICGTRKALREIVGSSYSGANSFMLSENMKNDLNQTGMIQYWNGIPLLEIPQVHTANDFEFMLDDKTLMILPANTKPIKVVTEGQSMIKAINDGVTNLDQTMEYTFIKRFGIGIIFDTSFGVYKLV